MYVNLSLLEQCAAYKLDHNLDSRQDNIKVQHPNRTILIVM